MARVAVALVTLPLLADFFDRLARWLTRRYRRAVAEGDRFPTFSWVLWARITHRDPDYDHDLWVIRLPSWQWSFVDFGASEGWVQLALVKRMPFERRELFAGDGWRAIHIPVS